MCDKKKLIPVTVNDLAISQMGFIVLLKSRVSEYMLPIYIGPPEAQAIILHLNKIDVPRPMSHDLFKNILDMLEARLDRVVIFDVKKNVFFSRIFLNFEGQDLQVDSRPSDAIALALRCHAPIFVTEEVLADSGIILDDERSKLQALSEDPVDELKEFLRLAISEERYEDAARLRDEIQRATSHN